jgi:hypothetical protein
MFLIRVHQISKKSFSKTKGGGVPNSERTNKNLLGVMFLDEQVHRINGWSSWFARLFIGRGRGNSVLFHYANFSFFFLECHSHVTNVFKVRNGKENFFILGLLNYVPAYLHIA